MPNIAATFRQEITRLARKEVRSQMVALRKASARFRKDIAQLKRDASQWASEISNLHRLRVKHAVQAGADGSTKVRFRAKGVTSHRKRLGISAADYGKLVGVTGHTIYKWEQGAARPRKAQLAALAAVRGLRKREVKARLGQMVKGGPAGRRRRKS
jgi:DNA-binding transcriptional regulator YiaG